MDKSEKYFLIIDGNRKKGYLKHSELLLSYDEFSNIMIKLLQSELNQKNVVLVDNDDVNSMLNALYQCTKQNKSLLISGYFGKLKTTIAKMYVTFMNHYQVLDKIEYKVEYKFIRSQKIKENIYNDKILVIDELGRENIVEKHYGTETMPVYELLLDRYELNLPTILISNFKLESTNNDIDLKKRYDMYLFERLKEQYFYLELKGNKSYRNKINI